MYNVHPYFSPQNLGIISGHYTIATAIKKRRGSNGLIIFNYVEVFLLETQKRSTLKGVNFTRFRGRFCTYNCGK